MLDDIYIYIYMMIYIDMYNMYIYIYIFYVYLYEKLEIMTYRKQKELLNERFELLCKCRRSNINEVIRPVLNFLFFYDKISQVQKSIKT